MGKMTNQGFMRVILLAIVVISGLAYFSVDLRDIIDNHIIPRLV